MLAVLGASLVLRERDHVHFITRRLPVEVANALARSRRWLSKSRSEPDHSLSIYGNETTQNWPCKRSNYVNNFAETLVWKQEYDVTNSTHQIQMTAIRYWMDPSLWKFSAYGTAVRSISPTRNSSTYLYVAKLQCRPTADSRTALVARLKLFFRFAGF